jgi:hypothetical protein
MSIKKFFAGMAVLLSVSLFLIGCPTEADSETVTVTNTELIHFDAVVATEAALEEALADPQVKAIAFLAGAAVTVGTADVLVLDKALGLFSELKAGGKLDIQAPVYVYDGGNLNAFNGLSVTEGGRISVQKGGTLTTTDSSKVSNGAQEPLTVLGTDAVFIAGTLAIEAATAAEITAALGYIENGAKLAVDADTALPSAVVNVTVPAGKSVEITANGAETAATLAVPAGVKLTTTDDLSDVTELTVNGELAASSATGKSDGVKIVVGTGAEAAVGTLAKVLDESSVAGELTAVITVFDSEAVLSVAAGATVNGITFPAATTIETALAADDVTVSTGFTVPADGMTLKNKLTLATGVALALTGDVAITGADGALVLSAAENTGGASLTGTGAVKAGNTEIVGSLGGWRAVGASGDVTIAASATAGESSITGDTGVLTAGTGATITQLAGAGNNLTTGDSTVINFGTAGTLVLKAGSDKAKITLTNSTDTILKFGTGATTGSATNAQLVAAFASLAFGSGVTGKTSTDSDASGTLTQIIGASSNNTLEGPESSPDVTIDATKVVANNT